MRERAVVRRRRKSVERGVDGSTRFEEDLWFLLLLLLFFDFSGSFSWGDDTCDDVYSYEDPESVLKIRKKQKM